MVKFGIMHENSTRSKDKPLIDRSVDTNSMSVTIEANEINISEDSIDLSCNKIDSKEKKNDDSFNKENNHVTNHQEAQRIQCSSTKPERIDTFSKEDRNDNRVKNTEATNPILKRKARNKARRCNSKRNSLLRYVLLAQHYKHVTNTSHDFKCSKCDFCASTTDVLEAHILAAHEENKPFRCDACPSRFERKTQLIEHMMIVHDKMKSFKCTRCNKSFSRKDGLRRHYQNVHILKHSMRF